MKDGGCDGRETSGKGTGRKGGKEGGSGETRREMKKGKDRLKGVG